MRSHVVLPLILAMALGQAPPDRIAARQELAQHQGTWLAVSFRRDDRETPPEVVQTITRTVEDDHVVWRRNGKNFAGTTMVLDPSREPKSIDIMPDGGPSRGKKVLGIYRLDGDRLTLCMADPDGPRPTAFAAAKGTGHTLMTFNRQPQTSPRSMK